MTEDFRAEWNSLGFSPITGGATQQFIERLLSALEEKDKEITRWKNESLQYHDAYMDCLRENEELREKEIRPHQGREERSCR